MPPDEPAVQFDYAQHEVRVLASILSTAPSVADNPPSAGTSPLPSAESSPEPLALWVHERSGRCAFCDVTETTRTYVKPNEEDQMSWKWCHPECQEVATLALRKKK